MEAETAFSTLFRDRQRKIRIKLTNRIVKIAVSAPWSRSAWQIVRKGNEPYPSGTRAVRAHPAGGAERVGPVRARGTLRSGGRGSDALSLGVHRERWPQEPELRAPNVLTLSCKEPPTMPATLRHGSRRG